MTLSGFRAGFYPLLGEERIAKKNDTLSLRKGEGKGEGFLKCLLNNVSKFLVIPIFWSRAFRPVYIVIL